MRSSTGGHERIAEPPARAAGEPGEALGVMLGVNPWNPPFLALGSAAADGGCTPTAVLVGLPWWAWSYPPVPDVPVAPELMPTARFDAAVQIIQSAARRRPELDGLELDVLSGRLAHAAGRRAAEGRFARVVVIARWRDRIVVRSILGRVRPHAAADVVWRSV